MDKQIGIIGLGKMGANVARRLSKKGWETVGYNRTETVTKELESDGVVGAYTIEEFVSKLKTPRAIITLLPTGAPTDDMLSTLLPHLSKDDIIIEMANSNYKETQRRAETVTSSGQRFVDVGISGGPGGALNGACLMVGGEKELFEYLKPLFLDMAKDGAVAHFEGMGAGHFVKMVHNGIEYGMMQAIGEGFEILQKAPYKVDLEEAVKIYSNGSVIESRLVSWLGDGFKSFGVNLTDVSGWVPRGGEGDWTVEAAKELSVNAPVISDSVEFRKQSENKETFTGKVVNAIRNSFGGHSIERGKKT